MVDSMAEPTEKNRENGRVELMAVHLGYLQAASKAPMMVVYEAASTAAMKDMHLVQA